MNRKRQPTEWEAAMGTRLKRLREAAGLSQAGLARLAGVHWRTVQNYEYAKRTMPFDVAVKIADALGVGLEVLAGREQARKKKGDR
jgi:transcriptional regulator with XRE-family HTH domain